MTNKGIKNKIIITILFIGFIVGLFVLNSVDQSNGSAIDKSLEQEKIKIVACPTCYEMAKKLDSEKYQIIPTASTAESIELIKNNQADLMLAGRTLKPNEPQMDEIIIQNGYSFIGNEEFFVYAEELKNHTIHTDLDVEVIKSNFSVAKIEKVDDVYQYLDKGIGVTSWENTDYLRAKIVHILKNNGERVQLSRRPAVYCPLSCDINLVSNIISFLK